MTTATTDTWRSAAAGALTGAGHLQRQRNGAVVAPHHRRHAGTRLQNHPGHRAAATSVRALITSQEGTPPW